MSHIRQALLQQVSPVSHYLLSEARWIICFFCSLAHFYPELPVLVDIAL